MLPLTPDPVGTAAAAGAAPALKVMVLPLTTRTSPSFGAAAALRSVAAPVPVSSNVPASAAAPSPAFDATPTSAAETPPSVVAVVIGDAPPAVPLATTLLIADALVKVVVPRRSDEVAPAIVADTFDLVE